MGDVKLNSSGGGSVTLTTPSTASNLTVTLPSASGTMSTTAGTETLTNKTLTAAGSNTVEATSGPTSTQLAGQRNKIINGAMMIDQRNAGASVTPTADNTYTLDRWCGRLSQTSKYSVQQNAGSVTPPAGYSSYLGVTSLSSYSVASGDYFALEQRIEGFNTNDLAWGTASAKSVTLSFWVRSSLTGTFGGSIVNGSPFTPAYPFSYTIASANTWEQKTITISGPTTGTWNAANGIGASVFFGLGLGSSYSGTAGAWVNATYLSVTGATSVVGTNGATFYITGVQLEKGATATPFENRLYGTELMLCKRYYQKSVEYGTTPGTGSGIYTQGAYYLAINTGTSESMQNTFECELRAVPSMAIWSSNNSQANYAWSEITQNNLAFSISGTTSKRLGFGANPTGSGVSGNGYYVTWTASAEL